MPNNVQGVDLSTGKLQIPIELAFISGPNSFGETLTIQYSSLGLMSAIKTWNQDFQTGILGLGWSLNIPFIIRIGSGSINDYFLLNGIPLITKTKTGNLAQGYVLEFETSTHSLNKIIYTSVNEQWLIIDADGTKYIYGGHPKAVQYAVRWTTPYIDNQDAGPTNWIGSSVATTHQTHFVLIWNLSSKENIHGQKINYGYQKVCRNVGANGSGLNYDVASYLSSIVVTNGNRVNLHYDSKEIWEYPPNRATFNNNPEGLITNAYQDRVETKYLKGLSLYNNTGALVSSIYLEYGFLWENFDAVISSKDNLPMNKRVLIAINKLTPANQLIEPATIFDYWGYNKDGNKPYNDGYYDYFNSTSFNPLKITTSDIDGTSFNLQPYNNLYYQLFGHLKTIKSSAGAITWYSYRDISKNYSSVWDDFDQKWKNKLDLLGITYPDGKDATSSIWCSPKPFWGPDGYLVMQFYSQAKIAGYYQIHLDIYEWAGYWIKAQVDDLPDLWVASTDNDENSTNFIVPGQGFFILVRCNLDVDTQYGYIAILNRDPYLAGKWKANYFCHTKINLGNYLKYHLHSIYPNPTNNDSDTHVEINVGTKIISVVDKVQGILHAFGWNNISWDYTTLVLSDYFKVDATNLSIGSILQGSEIFILANTMEYSAEYQSPFYLLYGYQSTVINPWIVKNGSFANIKILFPPQVKLRDVVLSMSFSVNNGFVMCDILMGSLILEALQLYSIVEIDHLPLVISWTDDYEINYQRILNDSSPVPWRFLDSMTLFLPGMGYGSMMSFSDYIFYTCSNSKSVFRYMGGEGGTNSGWQLTKFDNNLTNNDFWGNLPLIDATIETHGTTTLTYTFHEYDANTQLWNSNSALSTALGSRTDWAAIAEIILFTIQATSILLVILAPFGAALTLLGNAIRVTNSLLSLTLLASRLTGMVVARVGGEVAGAIVEFIVGQGEMIGQQYLINYILKQLYNGYVESGFGDYIFFSKKELPLNIFYKKTMPQWQGGAVSSWTQLTEKVPPDNLLYPNYPSAKTFAGIPRDSFFIANNFLGFNYVVQTCFSNPFPKYYEINTGQIAFLRNGDIVKFIRLPIISIPQQYIDTFSDFQVYDNFKRVYYIAYQLDSTDNPSDNYTVPLTAPWGGILGFIGKYFASTSTIFQQNYYQSVFKDALSFGLFMTRDEMVEGYVKDYVIDKIAIEDGYQTFYTHFQYMPQLATLDKNINSIRYNQVNIASGEIDYLSSSKNFGWSENYFYTHALYSKDVTPDVFPFDPAVISESSQVTNNFNKDNGNQVNTDIFNSLMVGKLYCERTLKDQSSTSNTINNGYEIERSQIFYKAFTKSMYDSQGGSISSACIRGVLETLSVNYKAAPDTIEANIYSAYCNNKASINYSYNFYDMLEFYGPFEPSNKDSIYQLVYLPNNNKPLQSGLLLGTLSFNYHYQPSINESSESGIKRESFYTQIIPGIYIPMIKDATKTNTDYMFFYQNNFFNANVQNISWYHGNLIDPPDGFLLPKNSWGLTGWEVISSQVQTWKLFQDNNNHPICWHKNTEYAWRGNAAGTPQNTQLVFGWKEQAEDNKDWMKGVSIIKLNRQSIITETQDNTNVPYVTLLDKQRFFTLANFINAGHANNMAFYIGFEAYEDLSCWRLETEVTDIPWLFSTRSYSGNRSLELIVEPSTDYNFIYSPDEATFDFNDVETARDWLLIFTGLSKLTDKYFNVMLGVNYQEIVTQNFEVTTQGWQNYYILAKAMNITNLSNLQLVFNFNQSTGGFFIDGIYFIPLTESGFNIQTYASSLLPLANATVSDRFFNSRFLYDNLQKKIGMVRKNSESNSADQIVLAATYYSRDGSLTDSFDSLQPNSNLTIKGGNNNISAGQYYDLRDEQNPWQGGIVKDRSLFLSSQSTATLSYPVTYQNGVGIRLQMQGYLLDYATKISGYSAAGLPAITPEDECWGYAYATTNKDETSPLYIFTINKRGQFQVQVDPIPHNLELQPAYNMQSVVYNNNPFIGNSITGSFIEPIIRNSINATLAGVQNAYLIMSYNPQGQYIVIGNSNIPWSSVTLGFNKICVSYTENNNSSLKLRLFDENDIRYNKIIDLSNLCSWNNKLSNAALMVTHKNCNNIILGINYDYSFIERATNAVSALNVNGQSEYGIIKDAKNVLSFDYNEDFTIEFWMQSWNNDPSSDHHIISKWSNNYPYIILLRKCSSGMSIVGARWDCTNNPFVQGTRNVDDKYFHHVAFVKRGKFLYLYIDGNLDGSSFDSTEASTANTADICLAYQGGNFQGSILELRIWNYGKSQSQILQQMKSRLTGKESMLCGYWPLQNSNSDLSCYGQDMDITGTAYVQISLTLALPNVLLNFDIGNERAITAVIPQNENIVSPPAYVEEGNVFVVTSSNTLYAFDEKLRFVNNVSLPATIVAYPVAAIGAVYLAFSNGCFGIYDYQLNTIAFVQVTDIVSNEVLTLTKAPFIYGDKIILVTKNSSNHLYLYTYNRDGLLVAMPYLTSALTDVSLQSFNGEKQELSLMYDFSTFVKLRFIIPNVSLSMGDYTVTFDWNYGDPQYQLSGTNLAIKTVKVNTGANDWLVMKIGSILYFYANGQQIFSEQITSELPRENIDFKLTSYAIGLACKDAVIINDPILATTYQDATGKLRQTQAMFDAQDGISIDHQKTSAVSDFSSESSQQLRGKEHVKLPIVESSD